MTRGAQQGNCRFQSPQPLYSLLPWWELFVYQAHKRWPPRSLSRLSKASTLNLSCSHQPPPCSFPVHLHSLLLLASSCFLHAPSISSAISFSSLWLLHHCSHIPYPTVPFMGQCPTPTAAAAVLDMSASLAAYQLCDGSAQWWHHFRYLPESSRQASCEPHSLGAHRIGLELAIMAKVRPSGRQTKQSSLLHFPTLKFLLTQTLVCHFLQCCVICSPAAT